MGRIGNELVARLVEVMHLLAHLVKGGGKLRHLPPALYMDAMLIIALAHALNAVGKAP